MKKTLLKNAQNPIPVRDQIMDKLLNGKSKSISIEQARELMTFVLLMLTPKQRIETLKKIERCTFFCDAQKRGMKTRRIKSIMMRKYGVDRRRIKKACEPCTKFMNTISKKNVLQR